MMRENVCCTLRISAVSSGPSSTTSGASSMRGDEVGLLGDPARSMRTRWPPWTRIRSVPVGHLEHARDGADDADVVELLGPGRLGSGSRLATITSMRSPRQHVVDELDRALLADRQRRQRVGERDGVAQRQDRQRRPGSGGAPSATRARAVADGLDVDAHGSPRPRRRGGARLDRDAARVRRLARAAARREHAVVVDRLARARRRRRRRARPRAGTARARSRAAGRRAPRRRPAAAGGRRGSARGRGSRARARPGRCRRGRRGRPRAAGRPT